MDPVQWGASHPWKWDTLPLVFVDFGTLRWGSGEHGDGLVLAENCATLYGVKRPLEEWKEDASFPVTETLMNSIYGHIYPSGSGTSSYVGDAVTEFHGSKTKIWVRASSGAWTNLSGAAYAAAGEPAAWSFASYGNDVWAANYLDELQVRANNTGNFATGTGGSVFKPKARFLAVVKNYMLAFDLNNAGHFSDSYAWSVPGNPAVWDAAASGGGGTGRITSRPGQIMGVVGGEFARVFKRNSMHVLQFTGDVIGTNGGTWREDVISESVGTPWPGSIVVGDQGFIYFLGNDSYFYRQAGVNPPERLSSFEVSAYLKDSIFSPAALSIVAPDTMTNESLHVQAAYNQKTGCLFWAYRATLDPNVRSKTKGVFYSSVTGEFTTLDTERSRNGTLNIQTLAGLPESVGTGETTAGIVGIWNSGGPSTYRWTFSGTDAWPFRLITRRQAIGLANHEEPKPIRIIGALPIVSTASLGDLHRTKFEGFPPNLTFGVVVSNDPNFSVVLDDVTEVNPRYEGVRADASADPDTGLFPFTAYGAWQMFQLSLPVELDTIDQGVLLRAMPGFWVRYEEPS